MFLLKKLNIIYTVAHRYFLCRRFSNKAFQVALLETEEQQDMSPGSI